MKKEDLATRQRLQEEFATELATIRGRVDASACSITMLTSRSTAVATQISVTLLLNAIAAAVIGGVSLFGGRGSV